jgi:VWFA-related protein
MSSYFRSFAIILVFCGIYTVRAQNDVSPAKPKEESTPLKVSIKTELMEVHAVIMDQKGRIVENLKKEDFELLENNKPQEISFFSISKAESMQNRSAVIEEAAREKPTAPGPGEEKSQKTLKPATLTPSIVLKSGAINSTAAPVRTTLFYVDGIHLSFPSLNRVKKVLRRFLNEQMTEQDMVALTTSAGTLGVAQQFSRDRQLLRYAIEQIRFSSPSAETLFTPRLAADVVANQEYALRVASRILREQDGVRACCSTLRAMAMSKAAQVISEAAVNRTTMLSILRDYTEQMVRLPGQRMIVIFSDGFTMYDRDGASHSIDLQPVINRAIRYGVTIYSIDAKGLQAPAEINAARPLVSMQNDQGLFGENERTDTPEAMAKLTSGAAGSRCSPIEEIPCANPGNPTELQNYLNTSVKESSNGLHSIATETGGRLFGDTNDLNGALGQAFDANRFYYVLSYYLATGGDPHQFRSIKVGVRNHPEYTVRTPRGFSLWDAQSTQETEVAKTPQQRLLHAMSTPLPVTDINVSARAEFMETEADDKQVTLFVYFDGDKFQYRRQAEQNFFEAEILYDIYDSAGKQVETISAAVEGKLSEERMGQAQTAGYLFRRRLTLKPGVYQARVGVRESGTERFGTASAWVEVPEIVKDKLDMSSLILQSPLDENSDGIEGINVSELEQVKMVQGVPLYAQGEFCDYVFRVYPNTQTSTESKLSMMREILQDGRLIKQESWKTLSEEEKYKDSKGGFDVGGSVDLKDFKPGIYELRISVKDAQSNKTAQRTTVFSIE